MRIRLNENAYEMHHDIKFMSPDESVVEKVENYAITDTGDTVMFLADSPDKPTDIDCICYKVDNSLYHCTSYYELSPKISIGFIFQKMLTLFVIANAYVFPVLLVWADTHKFYLDNDTFFLVSSVAVCIDIANSNKHIIVKYMDLSLSFRCFILLRPCLRKTTCT